MDSFPFHFRTCYGVDTVGDEMIAVRGVRAGRRVTWSRVDLGSAASRSELGRGRAVVACCLHERESLARWLEAPFPSRAKAARVYPSLLDVHLAFPLEQCVSVFIEADTRRGENARALAGVARDADVGRRLAALSAAGLDPEILDQESLALWTQGLREAPAKADGSEAVRVVVYLSGDRATMAMGRGRSFLAAHSMRQWRAEDAGRFLRSQQTGEAAEVEWLWAGPGATASAVRECHAQVAGPRPGASQAVQEPATFLARALAQRALLPDAWPCNLRTGAHVHPRIVAALRRRSLTTPLLFLVAGLMLCGINGAWRVGVAAREAALQRVIGSLASEVSGLAKVPRGNEVLVVQRALEQDREKFGPFLRAYESPTARALGELLDIAKAGNLDYDSLSLSARTVSVEGSADDWNACEKLSSRLAALGFKVKLDRKDALAEERIHFVLTTPGVP